MSTVIPSVGKTSYQSTAETITEIPPHVLTGNRQICELVSTDICVKTDKVTVCYQSEWHCWDD